MARYETVNQSGNRLGGTSVGWLRCSADQSV